MTHFESWVAWRGSMSHGWGKNPYIRAPSGHEFGFFMQPSKLLSLLLIQSTIFISLSTFEGQGVLRDNDPPYTILVRVLVSRYKREVFVIRIGGYLLQVLPHESPIVTQIGNNYNFLHTWLSLALITINQTEVTIKIKDSSTWFYALKKG